MTIKEGDKLRFKVQPRALLAGMEGVCRIEKFEKSKRGNVVYIDNRTSAGEFVRFARFWPFEIAFAPLNGGDFLVFEG